MLNIYIIDDEINIRTGIKKMLELMNKNFHVIGEASSIKEAKIALKHQSPDLVLLDIELKDGTGFDLLNQLETITFKVVFITAFNQYAIKAFKFNALDYLLKPVDPFELKETLMNVAENVQSEKDLKLLLQNLEDNKRNEIQKIVIKTNENNYIITIDDILYLKADGAYSTVYTKTKNIFTSKSLKYFNDLLAEYSFIRPHQSYLVNTKFIESFKNDYISLNNSVIIPVSKRRKSEILSLLNK